MSVLNSVFGDDYLGNVLASVLDRKTGVDTGTGSTHYAYYNPDMSSVQDYYPGGMIQRRNAVADTVGRFGYNGQQRDDEIAGVGKWYTALNWEYDPLTQTRKNRDPKPDPSVSPYAVFAANPIWYNDPLGDTSIYYNTKGEFIGAINDDLPNQVHFLKYSNVSKSKKWMSDFNNNLDQVALNSISSNLRSNSVAYIGENSMKSLQDLAIKAEGENNELGFVTFVTPSREILFKELIMPPGNSADATSYPPLEKVIGYNYTPEQQKSILGAGHIHFDKGESNSVNGHLNDPTWSTQWDRSMGRKLDVGRDFGRVLCCGIYRNTPLFIGTRNGITIYNQDAVRRDQQTRLRYDWFKTSEPLLNNTFKLD